jgi:hypothetical protein
VPTDLRGSVAVVTGGADGRGRGPGQGVGEPSGDGAAGPPGRRVGRRRATSVRD